MVNSGSDSILIIRAILSLIVTFFLSVGITLFLEAWKKKTFDIKFSLLIVAYGLIFFFTVDPNTDW